MPPAGSATRCVATESHRSTNLFPTGLLAALFLAALPACAVDPASTRRDEGAETALMPGIAGRVTNAVYRISGEDPEFAHDRSLSKQFVKGSIL